MKYLIYIQVITLINFLRTSLQQTNMVNLKNNNKKSRKIYTVFAITRKKIKQFQTFYYSFQIWKIIQQSNNIYISWNDKIRAESNSATIYLFRFMKNVSFNISCNALYITRKQFSISKAQLTLCTSILFCLWCQYTILHRYYPDVSIYHLSSNFKEGSLQRNNIQRHHINNNLYRFEFEGFWIDSWCLLFKKRIVVGMVS